RRAAPHLRVGRVPARSFRLLARKGRPCATNVAASAPTHGNDDFELVAVSQDGLRMPAFWKDVAIAFDRYVLAGIAQCLQEIGYRNGGGQGARCAVERDVHKGSRDLAKVFVASSRRARMPGSSKAWPASGTRWNCARGQARCNSQAVRAGVQTSYRPWTITP